MHTGQMKQAAPADKLQEIWRALVPQDGYTSVIVNTQFKNQTIGLLVTFDAGGKIGGMHQVPAL